MKTKNNLIHRALSPVPPADLHGMAAVLVKRIPRDAHARFKAKCAERGRSIQGVLVACIVAISLESPAIDLVELSHRFPDPR